MSEHHLILLSPYRFPGQDSTYLSDDDVLTFLNAYAALWHPAALAGRTGPPRIDSPYDHEQPGAGQLYSTPVQPPLLLPEDWLDQVGKAGSAAFQAAPDRQATLANLVAALRPTLPESGQALLNLPPGTDRPVPGHWPGLCGGRGPVRSYGA